MNLGWWKKVLEELSGDENFIVCNIKWGIKIFSFCDINFAVIVILRIVEILKKIPKRFYDLLKKISRKSEHWNF